MKAWLYVPIGNLAILATAFGINELLQLGAVSFPASVACLVILFFGLLLLEKFIGEHRTQRVITIVEVPVRLALDIIVKHRLVTNLSHRVDGPCNGSMSSSRLPSYCCL